MLINYLIIISKYLGIAHTCIYRYKIDGFIHLNVCENGYAKYKCRKQAESHYLNIIDIDNSAVLEL